MIRKTVARTFSSNRMMNVVMAQIPNVNKHKKIVDMHNQTKRTFLSLNDTPTNSTILFGIT